MEYKSKWENKSRQEIKEEILEHNLKLIGTSSENYRFIKIARKNIQYWQILKYKTGNFLNPTRIKHKLKMDPLICPFCKKHWKEYDHFLNTCEDLIE